MTTDHDRIEQQAGSVALIRNERGEILAGQRDDDGRWDLPGGTLDIGETPMECAVREAKEECGLDVDVVALAGVFGGPDFRHTYPDGKVVEGVNIVFACTIRGGTLKPKDGEMTQLVFFAPSELPPLIYPYPPELFEEGRASALFN